MLTDLIPLPQLRLPLCGLLASREMQLACPSSSGPQLRTAGHRPQLRGSSARIADSAAGSTDARQLNVFNGECCDSKALEALRWSTCIREDSFVLALPRSLPPGSGRRTKSSLWGAVACPPPAAPDEDLLPSYKFKE